VRAGEIAWPVGLTDEKGRLRVDFGFQEDVKIWLFSSAGRRQAQTLQLATVDRGEPLVVVFSELVHLRGQVIDAVNRRPLVGAVVWPGYDPAIFVRTNAEGAWELPASGMKSFWFQAEAPGYVPLAQRTPPPEPGLNRAPTLALIPAATASGQVVDEQDRPIEAARIEVALQARRRFFRQDRAHSRALTDAEGRFHLTGLSPGESHQLTVTSAGFSTAIEELSGLRPFKPGPDLRIVLRKSRPAHGWTVDVRERPIAGAEVTVSAANDGRVPQRRQPRALASQRAITAEDGRFETADVPASRIDLTVKKEGFAPVTVRGIEVPPGKEPVDLGTVILERGVAIEGRVSDSEQRPIAGVAVSLIRELGHHERTLVAQARRRKPHAETDAAGRFAVKDLSRGDKVDLVVHGSGYLPSWLRGVEAPTPEPVTIVLEPASRVTGEVVDGNGEPIAEADVDLESPGEDDWPGSGASASAVSDDAGSFILEPVRPGKAQIRVFARGFQPAPVMDLEVPAGEAIEGLKIVLKRGAVLEGRILTSDREPVAEARVLAGGSSAVSDDGGTYRLSGLLLGRQSIEVTHRQYGSVADELEIEPGVNTLDLIFPPGHEVTGQVVDEAGRPEEGARVTLENALGAWQEYRALSGEDGSFRLSPVADGEYALRAEKDAYASFRLSEPVVVSGGPVGDLEVRLARGGSITGRITGLDFEELAEVEIWVRKGEEGKPGQVNYEGRYEVSHVASGDWLVRASLRDGSRQAVKRVTLMPGDDEVSCDLEFGVDLTLSGRVIYGEEPLAGAHVSLRGHDVAAERSVATDHEGRFLLRDLKPGTYRLQAGSSRLGFTHSQELDLFSDRDLLIEIASARIRGKVVEASSSAPIPEAWVEMRRMAGADDAEAAFLIALGTEAGGSFSIPRVTPGRYRLSARKDGYAAHEQMLEVYPGADRDDLRLALSRTAGLVLDVRLASGRRPRYVSLGLIDPASGRTVAFESRNLDEDGRVRFPTVSPGTWSLLLTAPGAATTAVTAVVPGEPVPAVMSEAGQLRVRVPDLVASDLVASLTLTGVDGRRFRGISSEDGVREWWPVAGGHATVGDLPPGLWTLNVRAPDGESWMGSVVAEPGAPVQVTCTAGRCSSVLSPSGK